MLIDVLLNPQHDYADTPPEDLPPEILRDHLLRAMLAAHLAQRESMPMERLPVVSTISLRLISHLHLRTLRGFGATLQNNLDAPPAPRAIGRYGALLVYAITLWRVWRQERLPCSPGFALLAPQELFTPQDLRVSDPERPEWARTYRVQLAPAGCRPLRERWESAPAKAYREPITHAEVLDGLSLIIEDELSPLRWRHIPPWSAADAVRPLSARAATERRAPRLWLFPLDHGKLEFEPLHPQRGRAWTGGFVMKLAEPMSPDHRDSLELELRKIAQLIAAQQETGPSRDVLLFPELCLDKQGVDALRRALREAGAKPALVIAGSHHASLDDDPRLMCALAPIFADGEDEPLWSHQKRGPFRVTGKEWMDLDDHTDPPLNPHDELWEHIRPGDTFTTFDAPGGRVGVLICADLLDERFPSMRDLVRIALVDLLLVVNYSFKTTLFMRHAEQLNRLGVCAVFLNAATVFREPPDVRAPTEHHPLDPFSALVALPQLALPSAPKRPTWLTWRHQDRRVEERVKGDWVNAETRGEVAEHGDPAALFVDLNAWLAEPTSLADDDPVMNALGQAINSALADNDLPRAARAATLKSAETSALQSITGSIPVNALELLKWLSIQKLFEPEAANHHDPLQALFALRLARPHRLAAPPKEGNSTGINAESSVIVSLTPLGDALALTLEPLKKPARSSRIGA